jgi:hypothetical protein
LRHVEAVSIVCSYLGQHIVDQAIGGQFDKFLRGVRGLELSPGLDTAL